MIVVEVIGRDNSGKTAIFTTLSKGFLKKALPSGLQIGLLP